MAKHITTETEQHQAAFQHYLAQGDGRSLAATASHLGVSTTTMKAWKRSFRWDARVLEHEANVSRRTIDLAERQGVEVDARARSRNLQIVRGAMLKLAQALATGDVKFTLSDLPRLVALEQALVGEPVNDKAAGPTIDADLEGKTSAELWAILAQEVETIHRIAANEEEVAQLIQAGKLKPFRPLPFNGRCATCGHLPAGHEDESAPQPAKSL